MLAKNTALEHLALGDAELGDDGVGILCNGLASNTALKEIELDFKGLTPVGATALAGKLQFVRNDIHCELKHQQTRPVATHAPLYAYSMNCMFAHNLHLPVDHKLRRNVKASCHAGALKRNKGLRKLLLSRNPALGDEGVKALCEGLSHSSIRNLQLEEVGMGDEVTVERDCACSSSDGGELG